MRQKLDLTDYELVFCEEFDGDSLDRDVWNFTPPFNGCISSENSFEGYNLYGAVFNEQMMEFSDSNLIMHIRYCEDGIESMHTDYAVSRSPEHLILSYCLRQGKEDDSPSDKVFVDGGDGKFIIDYAKAYQKP